MQAPTDDLPEPPPGVTLRDPSDSAGLRQDIEDQFLGSMDRYVNGYSYGGVRLELKNLGYVGPNSFSKQQQHEALLSDRLLSRRLRGTVRLVDEETNKVLDERKNMTLARVPYLTERGTFIDNGSEFAPIMQSRLLPGVYTRRRENGELECFHKSTRIWTEEGMITIGKIVRERLAVRVWSYDFASGEFVLKPVVGWHENPVRAGMGRATYDANGRCPSRYRANHGALWVTPNHNFLESDGSKREVCQDTKPLLMVEEAPSASQEQVLIGSLLGDGFISPDGIFQEAHCLAQQSYLEWKAAVLSPFVKDGVKPSQARASGYAGSGDVVAKLFTMSCAFLRRMRSDWYPGGSKTIDAGLLANADARALAVWFQDDGCAFLADNGRGPTSCQVVDLATMGFARGCIDVMVGWLSDRWGVSATPTEHKDARRPSSSTARQWSLKLYGEHAERFLVLVAPYIHPSMAYKLPQRPPAGACEDCGKEQSRTRKRCNGCWLRRYEMTPDMEDSGLRKRFGSMAAVRALVEGGRTPPDNVPGARWDAMMATMGTQVDAMVADSVPTLGLREVDYSYEIGTTMHFEKVKVAYDIEVEDTHNYVAHGVLVSNSHFNTRPGTGAAMRVTFDPSTAQYRIKVGTSNLHAYSVFKDMGVSDEELARRWGPEILEANKTKYAKHTLDRLYTKAIPKWERDETRSPLEKVQEIRAAFDRAQVAEPILRQNLPNLFSQEKAASWRKQGRAIQIAQDMVKEASRRFNPDFTSDQIWDQWVAFEVPLEKRASFQPDLSPDELKESYNAIYGRTGPQLASMRHWPQHWLTESGNEGWLEWYKNYDAGRRGKEDDKQKARWKNFKSLHGSQFIAKPTPRRAFALTNWGIDPLKMLSDEKATDMAVEMEKYRRKEYVKWFMNRHDFDDDAAIRLRRLAKGRGAEVGDDEVPGPGELMRLALGGYIEPKDLKA